MQSERLARAQMALARGDMTVLPLSGRTWIVASIGTSPKGAGTSPQGIGTSLKRKGSQYTVSLDGTAWACTCPDFARRCQRFSLLCKHIEAVRSTEITRLSEAGQNDFLNMQNIIPIRHTEESMALSSPPTPKTAGQELPVTQPGLDAPPHRGGDLAAAPTPGYEPGEAPPGSRPGNCPLFGRLRCDRSSQRVVPVWLVIRSAHRTQGDALGQGSHLL